MASFALPDDAVAIDLGASTGYFSVRLAELLKNGKVIALDAEPNMTACIATRAAALGLQNVEASTLPLDGDPRLDVTVDLIPCVDAYHHLPEQFYLTFKLAGSP